MPGPGKIAQKESYHNKVCSFLEKFDKAFIVHADNVGSQQFQDIRKALRPQSIILMGKNTMMKRSIRIHCETTGSDKWACLLDQLVGNVGVMFTTGDFAEVRTEVEKFKVGAAARVGTIAPNDVHVPSGITSMDPSQTSFFQALGIATKINKGTIEIVSDVHLIKTGDRVGPSQATLLVKLGVKPFKYGLMILKIVENGALFDPKVMDITDEDMLGSVQAAIANVAALSIGANYPTIASVPHSFINAYKNVLAIGLETGYSFPAAEKIKAILANPSAFATAAPAAAAAAPAAAAPAAKEEVKEESEEDMGFSLFD